MPCTTLLFPKRANHRHTHRHNPLQFCNQSANKRHYSVCPMVFVPSTSTHTVKQHKVSREASSHDSLHLIRSFFVMRSLTDGFFFTPLRPPITRPPWRFVPASLHYPFSARPQTFMQSSRSRRYLLPVCVNNFATADLYKEAWKIHHCIWQAVSLV